MCSNEIREAADYIVKHIGKDVVVHKYQSYTTNSIYLKFDYGIAHSLRISDHIGKRYLSYRFNVGTDIEEKKIISDEKGYERRLYPITELDSVVKDIMKLREERINEANNYEALKQWKRKQRDRTKGFWKGARRVQ